MIRSEYLTKATLGSAASENDFRSVLDCVSEQDVREALLSRFTLGLFNGAVGARRLQRVDNVCPQLEAALEQAARLDDWVLQSEAEIALDQTLDLIRMELLQALVHCSGERALGCLREALEAADDAMHFAVLEEVKNAGRPCHAEVAREYIRNLPELSFPKDTIKHLQEASIQAIDSSGL